MDDGLVRSAVLLEGEPKIAKQSYLWLAFMYACLLQDSNVIPRHAYSWLPQQFIYHEDRHSRLTAYGDIAIRLSGLPASM